MSRASAIIVAVIAALIPLLIIAEKTQFGKWNKCTGLEGLETVISKEGILVHSAYLGVKDRSSKTAKYGVKATKRRKDFSAIVIHSTINPEISKLIKYGHSYDYKRKGSFGYHFYIDQKGNIQQAAPLTKRTNHVLPPKNKNRKKNKWGWIANWNSISIGVVGALSVKTTEENGQKLHIATEKMTFAQLDALLALVTMLRDYYEIESDNIVGHGELQTNRLRVEGNKARSIRENPKICY